MRQRLSLDANENNAVIRTEEYWPTGILLIQLMKQKKERKKERIHWKEREIVKERI